jgi:hypothetical protein
MVIAAFFLLESAAALAQSGGTFTPTGSTTIARSGHTATLLPNGKVLIAGGYTGSVQLASAELYDPATGTFARTGDMTTPRAGNTAVLLPNGKVLIAGGVSAELYDPSTGTFTVTGDPVAPGLPFGGGASAVVLANGSVLYYSQLYDPITGTFSLAANPFWANVVSLLADGRVFLGDTGWLEVWPYAVLYNPASDATQATGTPGDANLLYDDGVGGAPLANGKVLLAGGISEVTNLFSTGAELYDPLTGTFSPTGDMTLGRAYYTATPLGDGSVLIAGSSAVDVGGTAELYDPVAGVFSRTGNPTMARIFGETATLLQDGTVLTVGGWTSISTPWAAILSASAELYKPSAPVPAPLLFSVSGDGQGQGAIWHAATGQVASGDNPAIAGEALSMYTTSLIEGGVIPPQVSVGGRLAEILYFGDAPGYPGYFQVNFRVPGGISPGAAVPVRLTYFGRPSNATTIAGQ